MAAGAGWEPARVRRATELVVLDFPAEDTHCPECGARLRVLKSHQRRVVTLAQGAFIAREIQRVCRAEVHPRPRVAKSKALARLVPPYQRYGWDLIVHVGLRRSLLYRQRREIQQELRDEHGIEVSAGTLSALSDRFLRSLETLHRARAPELRAAMESEGGYSLHIDSTNETGRGGLFLCLDGVRGWVLNSGKIASERWESLAPIVAQTVTLFGHPVATVSDMSKACARALAPLTHRGIPNFICHYHFVADIGADLMRRLHDRLKAYLKIARVSQQVRGLLSSLKVEDGQDPAGPQHYRHHQLAALLYWILHGNGRKTPRFPFGLPHLELFDRIQSAPSRAEQWVPRPWHPRVETTVEKLDSIARDLDDDRDTCDLVHELRQRWHLFDELRQILRLEADPCQPKAPLLPAIELRDRRGVETDLKRFEDKLHRLVPETKHHYSDHSRSAPELVLAHLARYRHRLFGHPVLRGQDGQILHIVERSNNCLEHFLSKNKQGLRRRTGRRHLARDLEDLPPQAPLVENLCDPRYLRVLCGSIANLPGAMARAHCPATPQRDLRHRPDADLQRWVRDLCCHQLASQTRQPTLQP